MENYAMPPLLVLEFEKHQHLETPHSPLGSPPNTPKRNSLNNNNTEVALNTSMATNGTNESHLNNSVGAVVYSPIDVPMDELDEQIRHVNVRVVGQTKSNKEELEYDEGPDDELPSLAKQINRDYNHSEPVIDSILMPLEEKQLQPQNSAVAILQTPERDLLSPPKVLKKTTVWDENDNFYENEGLIPLSPSPMKVDPKINNNNNNNNNNGPNRVLSTSMPYERRKRPVSNFDSMKNQVLDEFDSIVVLQDESLDDGYPDDEAYIAPTQSQNFIVPPRHHQRVDTSTDIPDDERAMESGEIPQDKRETSVAASTTIAIQEETFEKKQQTRHVRRLTPKTDLQTSEKSNQWLQEEFQRRSVIKEEINDAILIRESSSSKNSNETDANFAEQLSIKLQTLEDDKVAVNTEEDIPMTTPKDAVNQKFVSGGYSDNESTGKRPVPRRLNYDSDASDPQSPELGRKNPDARTVQDEMKRFASDTRAALRNQSNINPGAPVSVPLHSVAAENGYDAIVEPSDTISASGRQLATPSPSVKSFASRVLEYDLDKTEPLFDLKTKTPVFVQSIDSFVGISKGDITLSLLNEMPQTSSWAGRVHAAICRCRLMRNKTGAFPEVLEEGTIVADLQNLESIHEAALAHLLRDEIEEALELYKMILRAYHDGYEKQMQQPSLGEEKEANEVDYTPYLGVALHNIGILHILKKDYNGAMTFFTQAAEKRKSLGEGQPDHVASLVKKATCHFALNEYAQAHKQFDEALAFARKASLSLDDQVQMAEILNNLGCLAYMCGQPEAAHSYFRECMDVQFRALSDSLYERSAVIGQSISLNISIVKANIGFIRLVTKDLHVAVTAFENALMEQQILMKGAHDTLLATMDHLAVANLLNGRQQKAANMFGRILEIQKKEYGPQDPRCYITIDKINMMQSRGADFEAAIEGLQKTFSYPNTNARAEKAASIDESLQSKKSSINKPPTGRQKGKSSQKNKVIKALNSKKKTKS